jgi:hypothetical protein
MKGQDDTHLLKGLCILLLGGVLFRFYESLSAVQAVLFWLSLVAVAMVAAMAAREHFSKSARQRRERLEHIRELPRSLLTAAPTSIQMGEEKDLGIPIYLPDSLRTRHVHILGVTGSGKTESVILNFLRQDVARGLGSIILDAKGDASFLESLKQWVPSERLRVFDLGGGDGSPYDPLAAGSPLESAQRLFASLTWSEEYYKLKAQSALQRLFERHFRDKGRNPTLMDLAHYLKDAKTYAAYLSTEEVPEKAMERDYEALDGLVAQVQILCTGHLSGILSPSTGIRLEDAGEGMVLYFRLQSLLSPQLVKIVGKLLINHINFLAGRAHRAEGAANRGKLIPTYLDEFATFVCPEFADLISKARSAGLALHFSHQSIGDIKAVSESLLGQITDNSATKIILRVSDPDSAEFFSRAFGTRLYQKVTQRITNAKETDNAEIMDEGTTREAHQFRAPPDLLKTLPTGMGAVLVAHGEDAPQGASSVFKIKFPRMEEGGI